MNSKSVVHGCAVALLFGLFTLKSVVARSQEHANGQALFAANCSDCHGSDARGGERAPDIATRREVVSRTDADLIRVVKNGLPGTAMPAFGFLRSEEIDAVVRYLRKLQGIDQKVHAPGDPYLGEQLFHGRAGCSKCHMVNGRGGFFNSDLSNYASGRPVEDVKTAIVDPDRNLDRKSETVTVVTRDHSSLTGLIRSEDNFLLVLQTDDGTYHSLPRQDIVRIERSGHSLMPGNYQEKLSSKEIEDLVSYLIETGSSKGAQTGKDDSDEQ
jgi:cytochrome c oxidase cbb3-type subunit III